MGISTIRVSPCIIEEMIFQGKTDNNVTIRDIKWDDFKNNFIFTIEGIDVPDCKESHAILTRQKEITMKFEPL